MQITLPDGRKATVIGQATNDMVTIQFEDGRQSMWPISKLPKPEGEDTLKLVKVSALERYFEFRKDSEVIRHDPTDYPEINLLKYYELLGKIHSEALQEYKEKWGLT